ALTLDSWPWRLRIQSLGSFSIERDDAPDAFRGKHGKPLELLKVAVAFGGNEVNVDRITDVLWPRIDADYAHRSFNTTLHRLRRLLGDEHAITLQGGKLSLNARWFWLDTWALEHAIAAGNECLGATGDLLDHDALIRHTEAVLALYAGPFMRDTDEAWALAARESWQRRYVRFLTSVARFLTDSGHGDAAVRFLERGIEADELAEPLYRQLMMSYEVLDRNADVVETFERCRRVWQSRLGREPSDETLKLREQLAQNA
ncbi:MAG: AAA family ATPase, partial [Gammaproteobacteria bacterium]|nr:AAA family ATPase [Gammaproteobacteria bacterium]